MKHLLLLAVLLSASAASFSCKSNRPAATSQSAESTADAAGQTYRLIVSFTSKGAGTSAEKKEALMSYVESHPKKPAYKTVLWGREGETDFCFGLRELSKKEQAAFVAEVRKIMSGSDQVIVSENAVCQHKGR